ncbi:Trp biosynthesis-associated membrane protein [Ornithinimicrobium sp. CNJ-824]|uniref:Trp biosynthesis-associated membrane protein n=1 Tax=Ornithinimicrobium sp. CNJ-824 TaxID=1904966 RepID=UPI00096A5FCB|nr:Trp biosynthesis-associated membrane protein [Ornithinimicrobium sp. CNJ-824]
MPRPAAGAALALLGLLVLTTTQPWTTGVVEPAPGSVRTPWTRTGGELVPWGPAAALAAAAATLVLLGRGGDGVPGRVLGAVALVGSLAATAGAVLVVSGRTAVPGDVVTAGPAGWAWAGLVVGAAAVLAVLSGLLVRVVGRADPATASGRSRGRRPPDPLPAERRRRQEARVWAELDAGRDPTDDPGAGTMAPGTTDPPPTLIPTPEQEHPMEHENHYHSKAAWVGVSIMLVATVLGSWAAVFGPAWLLWAGLGLFAVGALVWFGMSKAGYGAEAYEAPRPRQSTGHRG